MLQWGNKWTLLFFINYWAQKNDFFSTFACHPCAGTMLIFSVSFQFCKILKKSTRCPLCIMQISVHDVTGLRWIENAEFVQSDWACEICPLGILSPRTPYPLRNYLKLIFTMSIYVTLIRTDTTLDHSQKAEKICGDSSGSFWTVYIQYWLWGCF